MKKMILIMTGLFFTMFSSFSQEPVINIDKDLTLVKGGGGNSGILVTDKGVVVIDTKMGPDAEKLYNMAKEKAGDKPIIVINTHYHRDHTSGNHFYKGSRIYIGNYDQSFLQANLDAENMPTDFVKDSQVLDMGNETIILYDLGRAHTWHDLVVYLPKEKILFTGDLVFDKINPVLKKESGANVDLWISALKNMTKKFDIKILIPGHGQEGGKEKAEALEKYFQDMKTAAATPAKEKEITAKYKGWMELSNMASPGMTIKYIKENQK